MTLAEKILAKKAGKAVVHPGEIIECSVDMIMTHDATARIIKRFHQMNGKNVWDKDKIVMLIDHWVPADSEQSAVNQEQIRRFAFEQGLPHFYDVKEGICHQVMPEKGYTRPGTLIIGSDSHSTTYGAFGAFATGMGDTDMAALYIDGKTWLRVPETVKISLTGALQPYVVGKDIIIWLLGKLGLEFAAYRCIEFSGSALKQLDMASRMTISNMCVEMGAKAAIFPPDDITEEYLKKTGAGDYIPICSDDDAEYASELSFDISQIGPQIAAPYSPDQAADVKKFAGMHVDQVYIGSCTNGRLEDLESAYRILKGKKIADTVRMYISPASRSTYLDALNMGYIQSFVHAGGVILNPTCGACLGGQMGLLASDEVCISTCNRNYHGRMGAKDARIYLANAAVAAACAVAGKIVAPEEVL